MKNKVFCPKQPHDLLNPVFSKYMDYHEYFDEDLENVCMCVWSMKSKITLPQDIDLIILPDASIDIIVNNVQKKNIYKCL